MQEMQIRCDQVQAELDQANSGTKYLLERADGLRSQRSLHYRHNELQLTSRASAQLRSMIIERFLGRFTLSEPELAALTSREIPVGNNLFEALDRVERIRFDCQALLAGEEGTVQAGYVVRMLLLHGADEQDGHHGCYLQTDGSGLPKDSSVVSI